MNHTLFITNEDEWVETATGLLDLAVKGGWIMIPIGLLLFISIAVFFERLAVIRNAGKEDATFMKRIRDYIWGGKIESAQSLCRMADTPSSRMIGKGISRLGRSTGDIQAAVENAGSLEIARLERGFPWVATTAAVAPMLGFLGTVTGLVRAFFNIANAGTEVDIVLLSSGIYEALITTVAGLIAGIIALLAHNCLSARLNRAITAMEARSMEFMDLLNEPIK
jgi:biopolymer transport protein ExbB